MPIRPVTVAVGLFAASILAAGCEGAHASGSSSALSGGVGTYRGTINGAKISLMMPSSTAPHATEITSYAQEAGSTATSKYGALTIDNEGSGPIAVQNITVVTKDGKQQQLQTQTQYLTTLMDTVSDSNTQAYNDGSDLYNKIRKDNVAYAGAKTNILVVLDFDPVNIRTVTVVTQAGVLGGAANQPLRLKK